LLWYICGCDSFVAAAGGECNCGEACSGTVDLVVFAELTGGEIGAVEGWFEDDLDSVLVRDRFVLLLLLV